MGYLGVMLNWDKRPYDGKRESNLAVTFDATYGFKDEYVDHSFFLWACSSSGWLCLSELSRLCHFVYFAQRETQPEASKPRAEESLLFVLAITMWKMTPPIALSLRADQRLKRADKLALCITGITPSACRIF